MIKKKQPKLKLKPRILKKSGISLSIGKQKKIKKLLLKNRARNVARAF